MPAWIVAWYHPGLAWHHELRGRILMLHRVGGRAHVVGRILPMLIVNVPLKAHHWWVHRTRQMLFRSVHQWYMKPVGQAQSRGQLVYTVPTVITEPQCDTNAARAVIHKEAAKHASKRGGSVREQPSTVSLQNGQAH